jgi:hypothetical protein
MKSVAPRRPPTRQLNDARASSFCFPENRQLEPSGSFRVKAVLRPRSARSVGRVLFHTPFGEGSGSGLGSALFFVSCLLYRILHESFFVFVFFNFRAQRRLKTSREV